MKEGMPSPEELKATHEETAEKKEGPIDTYARFSTKEELENELRGLENQRKDLLRVLGYDGIKKFEQIERDMAYCRKVIKEKETEEK